MSTSHRTLKLLRTTHLYIGIFISPALLFFALTGALQTFSLHVTTEGSSYKPPAWIAAIAHLHTDETLVVPPDSDKPIDNHSAPSTAPTTPDSKPKSHLPMKIFFLLVAVGLFISTLTGIYMAYKYNRNKLLVTGLLLAGVVVPLLFLPF
jgi:hypothetical protein